MSRNLREYSFFDTTLFAERIIGDFLRSIREIYELFDYEGKKDKSFQRFFSNYLFDPEDKELIIDDPEKVWTDFISTQTDQQIKRIIGDYIIYRIRNILVKLGQYNGY